MLNTRSMIDPNYDCFQQNLLSLSDAEVESANGGMPQKAEFEGMPLQTVKSKSLCLNGQIFDELQKYGKRAENS